MRFCSDVFTFRSLLGEYRPVLNEGAQRGPGRMPNILIISYEVRRKRRIFIKLIRFRRIVNHDWEMRYPLPESNASSKWVAREFVLLTGRSMELLTLAYFCVLYGEILPISPRGVIGRISRIDLFRSSLGGK